jgi:Histidine kinase-like ATPase domain
VVTSETGTVSLRYAGVFYPRVQWVRQRFSPTPETILRARHLAWELAAQCGFESPEDVVLVTSELATNAVRHANTDYTVTLEYDPPIVRVEVGDQALGTPTLGRIGKGAETGRGLRVVDTLSRSWGTRQCADGGKVVWAEVIGLVT